MDKTPNQLYRFSLDVLKSFRRNQIVLLSGAVAFYALLSIIPILVLALIVLSHFVGEGPLFGTLSSYIEMVLPCYTAILTEHVHIFLKHRNVVSIVGFVVMIFFSSLAFSVLENTMSVIFSHRARKKRRRFFISAIIPYAYIILIGISMLLMSVVAEILEILKNKQLLIFLWQFSLEGIPGVALYALGLITEVFMITSIYMIMPVDRTRFRYALTGGIVATILWEIIRRLLVWYYSTLSVVNLIYGSFATAVVALLNIEAAVLILLLGAQVIAELEVKSEKLKEKG